MDKDSNFLLRWDFPVDLEAAKENTSQFVMIWAICSYLFLSVDHKECFYWNISIVSVRTRLRSWMSVWSSKKKFTEIGWKLIFFQYSPCYLYIFRPVTLRNSMLSLKSEPWSCSTFIFTVDETSSFVKKKERRECLLAMLITIPTVSEVITF